MGGDNVCNHDHFLQIGHCQLSDQSRWRDRSLTFRDAEQVKGLFFFFLPGLCTPYMKLLSSVDESVGVRAQERILAEL